VYNCFCYSGSTHLNQLLITLIKPSNNSRKNYINRKKILLLTCNAATRLQKWLRRTPDRPLTRSAKHQLAQGLQIG
jgi:hypothetical protein